MTTDSRRFAVGDRDGIPSAGCSLCTEPDGTPFLPMYGVAPHKCFWRKGPQFTLGQSSLVPFTDSDCFVPDLEDDEGWAAFIYPAACGIYYCPNCHCDEYGAAWAALVGRIGDPPADVGVCKHG
jgi:hypothetical protein